MLKITTVNQMEKMLKSKNITVPKWTFLETDVMNFAYFQSISIWTGQKKCQK